MLVKRQGPLWVPDRRIVPPGIIDPRKCPPLPDVGRMPWRCAISYSGDVDSEGKLEPSGDPETLNSVLDSQLTDGYIIVGLAGWDGNAVSTASATYDGTSMTALASVTRAAFGGSYRTHLFGLAVGNKAAGTYVMSANLLEVWDEYNAVVIVYNGVDQTTPTGTATTNNGSSTTPTVDVSSASGELVVDVVTFGGGSGTVHASQTQRWLQATATGGGASEEAGGATVTMSWTQNSADWTIAAVPLKPAAAGGGGPYPREVRSGAGGWFQ